MICEKDCLPRGLKLPEADQAEKESSQSRHCLKDQGVLRFLQINHNTEFSRLAASKKYRNRQFTHQRAVQARQESRLSKGCWINQALAELPYFQWRVEWYMLACCQLDSIS